METWVLYAIASLFFAGLFNFGFKIVTQRNYNTSYLAIIYYTVATFMAAIYYYFTAGNNGVGEINMLWLIIGMAFGNTLFFFFSTLTRVKSLENIDTTIFFPLYKTFFPIIITIISYFFLKEDLSLKEFIGILVGISVPLLLINKNENSKQKNLKWGLLMMLLTSFFGAISSFFAKLVSENNLNYDFYTILAFFSGGIISIVSYKFFGKKQKKEYSTKGIYLVGFALGIIQYLAFYTFVRAISGNFAIAITINSFSILIPIILSVIFYKEEMTKKKAFVIFLSIVSVILFI